MHLSTPVHRLDLFTLLKRHHDIKISKETALSDTKALEYIMDGVSTA